MRWTKMPGGDVRELTDLLLGAAGNQADLLREQAKENPELLRRQIEKIICGGYESSTRIQEAAAEVGASNFYGLEFAAMHWGIKWSPTDFDKFETLGISPFDIRSKQFLHALLAVPRLSVLDMRKDYTQHFDQEKWFYGDEYQFARTTADWGWHLVPYYPARAEKPSSVQVLVYLTLSHIIRYPNAAAQVHFDVASSDFFKGDAIRVTFDGCHIKIIDPRSKSKL